MSFVSAAFVLFFAAVLLLLKLFPGKKTQQAILLAASCLFYGAWDWRFLLLLLGLSAAVWYLGKQKTKAALVTGIALCLGVLSVFKYLGFFLESFCALFGPPGTTFRVILPLGLSYYVFQAISYLADTYRGNIAPARFSDVLLYIGFFPQIVSGPIVRAQQFLPQLAAAHPITGENLSYGIQRFCLGLFKKVVIADRLGVCVDAVFAAPMAYSGGSVALAVFSYAIQIYCDFSGYSDMAIGTARCMGFDLGENFRLPYGAESPAEFWRRWHISLSAWFREYVYIPLGGSRGGLRHTCCNLMTVMLLSGLWHGSGGTFLLWGALHGAALILNRLMPKKQSGVLSAPGTFLLVCLLWIPFRAESLAQAWVIFFRMATLAEGVRYCYSYSFVYGFLILGTHLLGREKGLWRPLDLGKFSSKVILCVFLLVTVLLAYVGDGVFLYAAF